LYNQSISLDQDSPKKAVLKKSLIIIADLAVNLHVCIIIHINSNSYFHSVLITGVFISGWSRGIAEIAAPVNSKSAATIDMLNVQLVYVSPKCPKPLENKLPHVPPILMCAGDIMLSLTTCFQYNHNAQ
jgi:hypothetical protein